MSLQAALFAAAVALPGPHADREPVAERRARVGNIAQAIASETDDPRMAFAALTKWWWESGRFLRAVHAGELRGDGGKAACLGQLHQTLGWVSRPEWLASQGTDLDATRVCARITVRVLRMHADRCRIAGPWSEHQVAQIFGAYGTGRTCHGRFRWAQNRARMWRLLVARHEQN